MKKVNRFGTRINYVNTNRGAIRNLAARNCRNYRNNNNINNTYLTGENLTLLNKFLIPTELHSPLPDKLYRYNENLGMQQSILTIEADVSHLANICSWNIRGTFP